MQDTRLVEKGGNVFPLSGVIVCDDCGGATVRKTNTRETAQRSNVG
jgi:rRNA maturation endonuclease Nob1